MIKIPMMLRAFLWASTGIALFGAYAKADNFDFSFTGSLGTVTGEIFGLTNTGVGQAATELLIFTYPGSLNPFDTNLNATTWALQSSNQFTESGGAITYADFLAFDGACPSACSFGFRLIDDPAHNDYGNLIENIALNSVDVANNPASFTPAPAAAPEPSSVILLSTVLLAVALVSKKRIAHSR